MTAKIVRARNAKGHFLPNGEVDPRVLDRIKHSREIKALAKRPKPRRVPEHERDLTHNPFAALLGR